MDFLGIFGEGAASEKHSVLRCAREPIYCYQNQAGFIAASSPIIEESETDLRLCYGEVGSQTLIRLGECKLTIDLDRFGEHAVFVSRRRGFIVFSSSLDWIRRFLGSEVSPRAVLQYIAFNYPLNGLSYYQGITRLRQGSSATYSMVSKVSNVDKPPVKIFGRSDENLEKIVSSSLGRHQCSRSDVFHLSGGLDSSLLVYLQSKRDSTVKTITAYFNEDRDQDYRYAKSVVEDLGAVHDSVSMAGRNFPALLDDMIRYLGAPVMAPGIVTFWLIAEHLKNAGASRAISGIGGDHPFIGAKLGLERGIGMNPALAGVQVSISDRQKSAD